MTCLLLAAAMLPQPIDAEALLEKSRSAYKALRSAEFLVKYTAPVGNKSVTAEARFTYQAPNKLAAQFLGLPSGPLRLVCDGKQIVLIDRGGPGKKTPFTVENLGRKLPTNVETFAFYDAAHELSTARDGAMSGSKLTVKTDQPWLGKSWTVLHEENAAAAVSVDYYIDPKAYLVWRTYGVDTKSKKPFIDSSIVELRLDPAVSPEAFLLPGT